MLRNVAANVVGIVVAFLTVMLIGVLSCLPAQDCPADAPPGDRDAPVFDVQDLYDEFSRHFDPGRAADFDRFRDFVVRQVHSIRESTGCERVRFRIESEEGRLKLKAKPI